MVGVEISKVVAVAQAELPVLLPQVFLKEKTISFKAFNLPLVPCSLAVQEPGPYRVRPLISLRLLVGKQDVKERVFSV